VSFHLLSENSRIKIYKNYELSCVPVWLCLTLREEHTDRLRVFETRVLRWIFGPMWDGVTAGWRGMHNEELYNLYSSPSIIGMIKSRGMRLEGM
jgi:hypothetical protein